MPGGNSSSNRPVASTVDGFINLYKPVGITSMDALRMVKRITGQRRKVGHAGTMDPLARGVLPICFGQATRLMEYVVDGKKRYRMEIELGATTQTYDSEGEITRVREPDYVTSDMVANAVLPFIGEVEQTPPMYSAIKVDGQRLYKLARAGVEVERKPRSVEIFEIKLVDFSLPRITLDVECGRGVYMRSLAHDLGSALECGGYVTDLERQYCAGFESEEGVTPGDLEALTSDDPHSWQDQVHPVDHVLRRFRAITVGESAATALRNGQGVACGRLLLEPGYLEQFRVYSPGGHFLGLARHDRAANRWQPVKVFQVSTPSPFAEDVH